MYCGVSDSGQLSQYRNLARKKQNFYLQKAPNQILKIEQKQKEIVNYLSHYGFTEYNDAD